MVDTWRWPNASYSAPSIAPIDTPRRAAVARSITMFWRRPPSSTSLPTSCSLGFFFSSATSLGSHSSSVARSLPCSPTWYCAPWLVLPPQAQVEVGVLRRLGAEPRQHREGVVLAPLGAGLQIDVERAAGALPAATQ